MQEWWDWDGIGPYKYHTCTTCTTPTISPYLSLVMQEWWDWDGFGPYKYRHHHYPNIITLYMT
jgi:hypothetical protein